MSSSPHRVVFEAGSEATGDSLVLLHGSHGTESDLLPLARRLAPESTRLGVRGAVTWGDGYAFFRRHPDRRVDETDIESRVGPLAALIRDHTADGRFARPPVVVGFSNGAIMAAALVATCPGLLSGAVLFRPLSPFTAADAYQRCTLPIVIIDGAQDPRRSPTDGLRLAERLSRAGADVTHRVLPVGHAITAEDEEIAREWLGT
jgi:phospholipase/carboxylesterase